MTLIITSFHSIVIVYKLLSFVWTGSRDFIIFCCEVTCKQSCCSVLYLTVDVDTRHVGRYIALSDLDGK